MDKQFPKSLTLVVTGVHPERIPRKISAWFCTCGNHPTNSCVHEPQDNCQPCSGPYGLYREDDDSVVFMDFYSKEAVETSLKVQNLPKGVKVYRLLDYERGHI